MLKLNDDELMVCHGFDKQIQRQIRDSNKSYTNGKKLNEFNPELIRVGKHGGLPFDSLVTDVVSGCLPNNMACYGMCFAALSAWGKNYDFGKRIDNVFDKKVLESDIENLPETQSYIRCGWNSDPSWNWDVSAEIASIAREKELLTIFVTKSFTFMDKEIANKLIDAKAEIRVSISAMDSNKELAKRLEFIKNYRDIGGICIPIVLTTSYKSINLQERQENIVKWVMDNDFPAAENSLRFPVDSQMVDLVEKSLLRPHDDGTDIWSGRIYPDKLLFPTTTSIPDSYSGIQSAFLSKLDIEGLQEFFVDPVNTHEQVINSMKSLSKPKMCGVSINYS